MQEEDTMGIDTLNEKPFIRRKHHRSAKKTGLEKRNHKEGKREKRAHQRRRRKAHRG
jgi:hypothetical protein